MATIVNGKTLNGTSANDLLIGADGNDTIRGGAGNDTLNGGNGSDTYLVYGLSDGIDTFKDSGTSGYDRVQATANATTITVASGFSAANGIEEISSGGFANVTLGGTSGNDKLDFTGVKLTGIARINGGTGNDTITGSDGNDTIAAGSGNDVLDGGNGSDTFLVYGLYDGIDTYKDTGATGYDRIQAFANGTAINLANGFSASSGIEEISAGGYTGVSISGTNGADKFDFTGVKLAGIASISAGSGNDTITGSADNDIISGGLGNDVINGGAGSDTAVFSGKASTYRITTAANGTVTVTSLSGNDGSDTLTNVETLKFADKSVAVSSLTVAAPSAPAPAPAPAPSPVPSNVLNGTAASETLTGTTGADTITGAAGNDTITGGAGNDLLDGGSDTDVAVFSGNAASYQVTKAADGTVTVKALTGTDGTDILKSIETLKFADKSVDVASISTPAPVTGKVLTGTSAAESLVGGTGSDTLTGGMGDDTLRGGEGGDTYLVGGAYGGMDTYQDSGAMGIDRIIATAAGTVIGLATGFAAASTGIEEISSGGFASVTIKGTNGADKFDFSGVKLTGIGSVITGSGDDTVIGSAGNDTINGGLGNDLLDGGEGSDTYLVYGLYDGADTHKDTGTTGYDRIQAVSSGTIFGLASGFSAATTGIEEISAAGIANIAISGSNAADTFDFSGVKLDGIAAINGGSGNDIITGSSGADFIAGGLGDDRLDGGAGVDTASFSGSAGSYSITKAADGTVTVKALSGNDGTDTLKNFESLKFTDKAIDVASLGTTSTTAPTPPPSTSTPTTSTPTPSTPTTSTDTAATTPLPNTSTSTGSVLHYDAPVVTGKEIVGFSIANTGTAANPAGYYTVGQVFQQGDFPSGSEMHALINGTAVPLQVDVKATWPDGSVKHAILTVKTPMIAAGGEVDVTLGLGSESHPTGTAITAAKVAASALDLKVVIDGLEGTAGHVVVDAKTVLQKAIADGTVKTWISGPSAGEFTASVKVSSELQLDFNIRMYADGTFKTDVVAQNNVWLHTGDGTSTTYSVAILDKGATVFSQSNVLHNQHATWHKDIYSSATMAKLYGQFDSGYLAGTGAFPAIDTSIGNLASSVSYQYNALLASNTALMGNAGITMYMPQTGMRGDIGPMTTWTAQYLQTMDARAAANLFAKADAAGSVPWHYKDEVTGEWVRGDLHPKLWLDGRVMQYSNLEQPVGGVTMAGSGWTMDSGHLPELSYLAYMVSGSQYYLSELQAQTSFLISSLTGGPSLLNANQTRALAWTLRDLANAAYISPDDSAVGDYFRSVLNSNLDILVKYYITDGTFDKFGALEGFFSKILGTGTIAAGLAPWQEDFVVLELGRLAEAGYTQATELLNWSANFQAGRFLHGDDGYTPYGGTVYYMDIYDGVSPSTTWADAYALTLASKNGFKGIEPTALVPGTQSESARAAMATLSRIGNVDGMEAFGFVVENTPKMGASYVGDSKFAVAFRAGWGGEDVAMSDYQIGTTGGDLITGSSRADVLIGGGGNDVIRGNEGTDALYGSAGNDRLEGGAGNDVLFGGTGNDTLIGGAGDDTMRGGTGADHFVFDTRPSGKDLVDDFEAGDKLVFKASILPSGVTSASGIRGLAHDDAHGNAVIDLGNGDHITIHHISASGLTDDMFLIQ